MSRKQSFLFGLLVIFNLGASSIVLADEQESYYSGDYFTDASGGTTLGLNMDRPLESGNHVLAGFSWMDARTAALGRGASLSLGFATDRTDDLNFQTQWTYWRFPGNVSGNGLDVLIFNSSMNRSWDNFAIRLSPVARNLRFVNQPNETILASLGLGFSGTLYTGEKSFIEIGGEESDYYGNRTVLQAVFTVLRASGNAPFVSSLVISRQYVELGYQFPKALVVVGYDRSKVVIAPNRESNNLYVSGQIPAAKKWTVNTTLGTSVQDTSQWYASIGVSYAR